MTNSDITNLRQEIELKRGEIYTNQLTMSVGELINLYENEEINLEPAFQRLFRWNEYQETNFIESILLGYPIPAIFVLQRQDGVWDVIDGVQRLSTLYHFVGILKNKDNDLIEPLPLARARILQNLHGKYYSPQLGDPSLDTATRIDFKRAALPVIILKHGSERKSKYELFRRLNTGGSHLSPQEIRNALILMYNENIYDIMDNYTKKESYVKMINISDGKSEIRMDMDILTRYLVMRNYKNIEDVPNDVDINVFLDDAMESIISNPDFDINSELDLFDRLIHFLGIYIEDDYGFKVYDKNKDRFKGAFNWFIYEQIVWGCTVLNNFEQIKDNPGELLEKIKSLKSIGSYQEKNNKSNMKVIQRLKAAKEEAKRVFDNDL